MDQWYGAQVAERVEHVLCVCVKRVQSTTRHGVVHDWTCRCDGHKQKGEQYHEGQQLVHALGGGGAQVPEDGVVVGDEGGGG